MASPSKAHFPFPKVSIIGRPNVGKSTLFNRIVGRRQSIVQEESGTTRDRITAVVQWEGKTFQLIDTGGIKLKSKELIDQSVLVEAEKAIAESVALIFVVDGKSGLTSIDEELADKIRRIKKTVVLAVNKVDIEATRTELAPFFKLGLGQPEPLSAAHDLGIGDLLTRLAQSIKKTEASLLNPDLTLSIVGEPNSGKSTLLNAFLNEERAIVSPIAGTTRDSIEEIIQVESHYIRIVDTAGIRHKRKLKDVTSFFSLSRAKQSIRDSDITYLLFDAEQGIRRDTKSIANYLAKEHKPAILVANKWDLTKGREQARYEKDMKRDLGFLEYSPVVFISALKKRNLGPLIEQGIKLWKQSTHHIPTAQLNQFLDRMKRRRLPTPSIRLKFLTQTSAVPQEFVCFVRRKLLIPQHYVRHFKNELVEQFGLRGIPIRLHFREEESKRV